MFTLTLTPLGAILREATAPISFELAKANRIQDRNYNAQINREGYTKIAFRPIDDVLVIDVTDNNINSNEALRFHYEVLHTRKDPKYQGYKKVLVNFQNVEYLNSSGLGCLIGLQRRLQSIGGKLELCYLSNQIKEVMNITKIGTILNIKETEEEALRALSTPTQ
jgi:anti-anti-sigma factor